MQQGSIRLSCTGCRTLSRPGHAGLSCLYGVLGRGERPTSLMRVHRRQQHSVGGGAALAWHRILNGGKGYSPDRQRHLDIVLGLLSFLLSALSIKCLRSHTAPPNLRHSLNNS